MNPQMAEDNPYWPNMSAVERAKDRAASLPPPQVAGAEWTLSEHDVECLTAGAGILASGGGGDSSVGYKRAKKVLDAGNEIKVVNPCRVDAEKMGLVCTIALMGDPSNSVNEKEGSLLALKRMQQALASRGRYNVSKDPDFSTYVVKSEDLENISLDDVELSNRITALTPVETGGINTIEPLVASSANNLPCLDAAGQGRSYPDLQMFMPFIYGCRYCPAVMADGENVVTCVAADSCEEMERFFRKETCTMGGLPSLAMGPIQFEAVYQKMVLFAISRAWQLGRAVVRAMKKSSSFLNAIVDQQRGYVLITGKITEVVPESGGGFTKNITKIEGADEYEGITLRVSATNENYVAEKINCKGEVEDILATIPDIIAIVDLGACQPLDIAVMAGKKDAVGKKVGVIVLPADPRLYTEQALKVVGPRGLGLNYDYQEPKILK